MIFDQIKLHNYGVYRGEHPIALSTTEDKPIVLFGALNGSGKTTLLEALQLALYGKHSRIAGRGRLGYHEYLNRCINRDVSPHEGAGLTLKFRHRAAGRDETLELVRTWREAGKGVKENFEVWRDGVEDPSTAERWAEFVEELLPGQISDLFFFDGEKVEALADPERSAELLRVGLHSLLGLDLVDRLIRSLGQVERRRQSLSLKAQDQKEVRELEKDISRLQATYDELRQEEASATQALDACGRAIVALDATMESSGGSLYLRRQQLEGRKVELEERLRELYDQLIVLAAGDAPLILIAPLVEELLSSAAGHEADRISVQVAEHLRARNQEIRSRLNELKAADEVSCAILAVLEEQVSSYAGNSAISYLCDVDKEHAISSGELRVVRERVADRLAELSRLEVELASCEKSLQAVPSEESVQGTIAARERKRIEKDNLVGKIEVLKEESGRVQRECERKTKTLIVRLQQAAEVELSNQTTSRVLRHASKSRATLATFRDEIAQRHMSRVEVLISECFAKLHRKKALAHQVAIDRDTYALRLLERGAREVPAQALSAGERQLLAVSVLWALARASGRRLPTIIDTPLGRLDGPHRGLLVRNYFPVASHQVILFSTDEEVTRKYYEQLQPFLGREYRIVFDEERRSSDVRDGYFAKEALAA